MPRDRGSPALPASPATARDSAPPPAPAIADPQPSHTATPLPDHQAADALHGPLLILNHHTLRLRFLTTKPPMRFTEVNAVSLHHKTVHVAAFVTRQTVPQLFLCIDHEARFEIGRAH